LALRSITITMTLVLTTALATWWIAAGGTICHYVIPLMLAGIVTGALPLLLALLIAPFEPELALTCVQIEVTAEATPPGTHTVHHLADMRSVDAGSGIDLDHTAATTILQRSNHREVDARLRRRADLKVRQPALPPPHDCATFRS
jgi:hypothetical protein